MIHHTIVMTKEIRVAVTIGSPMASQFKNQEQSCNERNAAADIAECIAAGGNPVHPLICRNVDEHSVIKMLQAA